jgi:hypothetical protein
MLAGVAASGKKDPPGAVHSTAWVVPSMTTTWPPALPTATSPLLRATGGVTTSPPTSTLHAAGGGHCCPMVQGINGYAETTLPWATSSWSPLRLAGRYGVSEGCGRQPSDCWDSTHPWPGLLVSMTDICTFEMP